MGDPPDKESSFMGMLFRHHRNKAAAKPAPVFVEPKPAPEPAQTEAAPNEAEEVKEEVHKPKGKRKAE
jgi:hypothetical protein